MGGKDGAITRTRLSFSAYEATYITLLFRYPRHITFLYDLDGWFGFMYISNAFEETKLVGLGILG